MYDSEKYFTWNPAWATSWALTKCVNWFAFRNRSKASTLKICAVPLLALTAKPSFAKSSIANFSLTVFGLERNGKLNITKIHKNIFQWIRRRNDIRSLIIYRQITQLGAHVRSVPNRPLVRWWNCLLKNQINFLPSQFQSNLHIIGLELIRVVPVFTNISNNKIASFKNNQGNCYKKIAIIILKGNEYRDLKNLSKIMLLYLWKFCTLFCCGTVFNIWWDSAEISNLVQLDEREKI